MQRTTTTQTAETPTAEAAPPGKFEVIHDQILLQAKNEKNSTPLVYGQVARLSDGSFRARWEQRARDGGILICHRPWTKDEDVTTSLCALVWDPRAWIEDQIASRPNSFWPLGPADYHLEIERFRSQWPTVAERLGIGPNPAPVGLFPLGNTAVPRGLRGMPAEPFRGFLEDQHMLGDFGVYGKLEEVVPSPELFWTAGMQSVRFQNSWAIARGTGQVRSRYVLPSEWQKLFEAPWGIARSNHLDVLTVLGSPGPVTLATLGHTN